jgi:sugar-specific transcriptional regulator TrmB
VVFYIYYSIVIKMEKFKNNTPYPYPMEQGFLSKLGEFGLNTYETKLWVALLSRGVSTAGELSEIANVPRSRSYDVLESLRKKGFVIVKQNKPMLYEAVSPEDVIRNTKEKIKERAERQVKLIEELKTKDLFKELEKIHKQSLEVVGKNEFVGAIKEKTNTQNQIRYMVRNAKKFIYINESVKGLSPNINFFAKTLPLLEKKGVCVKVMVNYNKNELSGFGGIKIKKSKSPNRFYIVDGEEMLFVLFGDSDAGILVNTKTFINSVAGLFNKQWNKADFTS